MSHKKSRAVLLAIVMIMSVMTAGAAFSGTVAASHGSSTIVVDDDGGEDFTTIQGALDHANDGDTIEVRAGAYDDVDVSKNVSLIGVDGPEETVIEGDSDSAIRLTGHTDELGNIKVRGFTLRSDGGQIAFAAFSDGNTDFDTDGLVVSNVVVEDSPFGIYFFDAKNVEISSVEVRNVEGAAVAMAGVSNVEIVDSDLRSSGTGVSVGVGFPESVYPDNDNVRISNTNIVGNNVGVNSTDEDLTVDATDNYWGHASGPSGEDGRTNPAGKEVGHGDPIDGDVEFDPWLRRPADT